METNERMIPDTRAIINQEFDQLIGKFEDQLKGAVSPETAEKFQHYFPELIAAFDELKQNLAERLNAIGPDKYKYLQTAAEELNALLSVVLEIAGNGLTNFKSRNCILEEKIMSSVLTRVNEFGKKIEIVFNFEPTAYHQARVAINIGGLSFRIDHVPENKEKEIKEAVYFDLDTPGMNKIFEGVRDKHSKGHHFRSEALREFTNKEKFRELVEFIKQILTESGKQRKVTVEDLIAKFKTK